MNRIKSALAALIATKSPMGLTHTGALVAEERRPSPTAVKDLRIEDALNGKVISFSIYKWNPNGPDTHERMLYVVGPDESLVDGIAAVLTMMEAQHGKHS